MLANIMKDQMEIIKTRVCVIGAGAAGLCAARHLAQNSKQFIFQVFEKASDVGGTWVYTDKIGFENNGLPIHTSMYKNLRTNLPKEIMHFPDFQEIKGNNESCVPHDVILDYLKNYTEHFKLREFIQFNTEVLFITPKIFTNDFLLQNWKVKVKNLISSELKEYIFDAVMICNGHYFDPIIPHISGINNFCGQVLHSHNYRYPENYTDQTVIILGASSSGIDIAFDLSEKSSRIFLSHNMNRLLNLNDDSSKITEVVGIDKFENEKFVLKDGSTVKADILIYCTGYHYKYAFMDKNCKIKVDENYVTPLYKHLINIEHPTMCFIGIPTHVIPFPMFHMQVQYFLSLLKGKAQLPNMSKMLDDSKLKSFKKNHAHKLGFDQWAYNDYLAKAGGFENLPAFYKLGFKIWSEHRKRNIDHYKHFNLVPSDDYELFRIVDNQQTSSY
ncbi:PREDICTED: flavin-containing monooxygenase FMO GS-OX-like 4 [Ceratosolen solmsi marchali]|uniref:Flavin-containing monooxygenase n=1 Tax=Ceratosolen solmsi marchali TaxID=326594 RepID=A0AAJ7DZM6_9HYME|nr:PREDICTED: flavin-containing monooxygenase FMO GS-OX-like 4 [Ceratosolen solmsi marchali]